MALINGVSIADDDTAAVAKAPAAGPEPGQGGFRGRKGRGRDGGTEHFYDR